MLGLGAEVEEGSGGRRLDFLRVRCRQPAAAAGCEKEGCETTACEKAGVSPWSAAEVSRLPEAGLGFSR